MLDQPFGNRISYKDHDKEMALKKHKQTCAKNRSLRKKKRKNKKR